MDVRRGNELYTVPIVHGMTESSAHFGSSAQI